MMKTHSHGSVLLYAFKWCLAATQQKIIGYGNLAMATEMEQWRTLYIGNK